ncbi:MAG TPA: anti-sigma factor [Blastocatellia bacterium]|nr:anti-sigma factor [Blastocatellia bacterium]
MKHQEVTEETREKAALYALGAMSQHEARAFEAHLQEGCEVCLGDFSEFGDVVSVLSTGVPEEAPPAYLRDLLAVRIGREPQSSPKRSSEQQAVRQTPVPATDSGSGKGGILPWAIAAAFALAALALFASWRQTRQEVDSARQQLASARGEAEELHAQVSQPRSDPRVIQLVGQSPAPGSTGQIYWDVPNNNWVVAVNLPPPPRGKVYQLWFVKPGARISAGLIRPNEKGYGFSVINVPHDLGSLDAAAITLEPEGGSALPTLPIYALGEAG